MLYQAAGWLDEVFEPMYYLPKDFGMDPHARFPTHAVGCSFGPLQAVSKEPVALEDSSAEKAVSGESEATTVGSVPASAQHPRIRSESMEHLSGNEYAHSPCSKKPTSLDRPEDVKIEEVKIAVISTEEVEAIRGVGEGEFV